MLETWVLTVVSLRTSRCGDLGVGEPAGEQAQDLVLALGEARDRARGMGGPSAVGEAFEQPSGDGRAEQRVAVRDQPDRVDEIGGRTSLSRKPLAPARIAA